MNNHNLELAYDIQKKFLQNKEISAYKVGASNLTSKNFFNTNNIIIGGIEEKNIYKNKIKRNYHIAELEIIVKIQYSLKNPNKFKVLKTYIGIECPLPDIQNEIGSEFVCIADNCSAGDLILIKEIKNTNIKTFDLIVSDKNKKFKVNANLEMLVYSIDEIILKTLNIIKNYNLPSNEEIFVSTGGISENFSLKSGQSLNLKL
tara:strand:+ start:2372 stop:2980 length:609 start_codon:yes stop_codon:yes gene_type:complete